MECGDGDNYGGAGSCYSWCGYVVDSISVRSVAGRGNIHNRRRHRGDEHHSGVERQGGSFGRRGKDRWVALRGDIRYNGSSNHNSLGREEKNLAKKHYLCRPKET